MVRKWSYLNFNYLNNPGLFSPSMKIKNFLVFKKTTKFKKFTKGLTRIVRRKYTKRSLHTSYLVFLQIAKYWSLHFIQSKQLARFTQSFGYSYINSHIPNFDIFKEATKPDDKFLNLHIFSCAKKISMKFLTPNRVVTGKPFLIKTLPTNSKISFSQTDSLNSLSNNEVVYPLNIYFENLSYHPYSQNSLSTQGNTYLSFLNTLFFTKFTIID
jgi:hypothetical protein